MRHGALLFIRSDASLFFFTLARESRISKHEGRLKIASTLPPARHRGSRSRVYDSLPVCNIVFNYSFIHGGAPIPFHRLLIVHGPPPSCSSSHVDGQPRSTCPSPFDRALNPRSSRLRSGLEPEIFPIKIGPRSFWISEGGRTPLVSWISEGMIPFPWGVAFFA